MSDIRVTYSGLIFLIIGIVTILTSLIFMLIVTRSLTPHEFGTWNLINGLIMYAIVVQPITSYWIHREIARGEKSGKTAIFSSGLFSSIGISVFMFFALLTGRETDVDHQILFFGVILVPILFVNGVLGSINMGFKPHVTSFGQLSLEVSKIPLAIFFVYFMDLGAQGVILTIALAHIPSMILLAYSAREKITGQIRREFLNKWLKLSWISLYPGIGSLFRSFDVLIFSVMTGSVVWLAYYGAAWSVSTLTAHAGSISAAVYSKLLGGGKPDYLQDNITQMFYFAIPLAALSITFARPGLFALNPVYEIAAPLVLIMTLRIILDTFSYAFEKFIIGIEKVDLDSTSSFKDYAKSNLFLIPTIRLIQYGAYAGILIILLAFLGSDTSDFDLLTYWALLGFFISVPVTIYLYIIVRRSFQIRFDIKSISKYLAVSIFIFGLLYFLTEQYLVYDERIVEFLPSLLLFVGLGVIGYVLLTCLIDSKTRQLLKAIINELQNKIK